MLRVVRIVVVDIHGAEFVEALNHHALAVGIDEAQWTSHLVHPFCTSPRLDSLQQRLGHLLVVHKVEPAETHLMTIPALIGSTIDDSSYTPHHLAVTESHEIFCLATLK